MKMKRWQLMLIGLGIDLVLTAVIAAGVLLASTHQTFLWAWLGNIISFGGVGVMVLTTALIARKLMK